MASKQFVIFDIENKSFGIEIAQVREIIKPLEIFKIPNTPEFVEGLINLRGKVHTVFSLRRKFGLVDKEFDDNTKIIIVALPSMLVGFIVDEVNEIIKIEDDDIENTPEIVKGYGNDFICGVAKLNDRIMLQLDLTKVLDKV